ncbi:hypothetical protein VNI00_004455 [Paramarasmius palmivorus]|uniref:Uncharacterized protein n=1 Tax=Paramarasmius palmivorus TaxID=297713 RepID=A0AAW0DF86_9AGAR
MVPLSHMPKIKKAVEARHIPPHDAPEYPLQRPASLSPPGVVIRIYIFNPLHHNDMDSFLNNLNKNNQNTSGAPQEGPVKGEGQGLLGKIMGDMDKRGVSGAPQEQVSGGSVSGSGGGFMDKINNAMGGGAAGERKEDGLDKGIDWVQEHVFKQGPQNNESAAEQMKDNAIADTIRSQYKGMTGKDFPIADK